MLELKNVEAGYGHGKVVLHDVNLSFPPSELAVIMGHNGAGKTTLLNTIFGKMVPSAGRVLFEGQPLGPSVVDRVKHGIAYSAAGQSVFPGLTVGENLEIAAAVRHTGKQAVKGQRDTVVALFPILAERWQQRAGTLSGGEQRMLSIGMALMHGPQVLLLDEPSLGLSPLMVENVYEVIARIRKDLGLAIVVVEQSINPTLLQADRLHILRMGRLVFSGGSDVLQDTERLWSLL